MAEKTLKQIADELKVDKQRIYRYVKKNHINEVHQTASTKYYSEAVQLQIKQAFSKIEPHQEPHQERINDTVYDALLKQLEIKDKQIEELTKLLDQEQQLNAINQQKILSLETEKEEPKLKWWQRKK